MSPDVRNASSIAAEDWLPVQEAMLRGLAHELSNRVTSLAAVSMLLEDATKIDERLRRSLEDDCARLGELLTLYRTLPGPQDRRREPSSLGDALTRAAGFLRLHGECRDITFTPVREEQTAEPVLLLHVDPVRAALLMLLALARGVASTATIHVVVRATNGRVEVVASSPSAKPELVGASAELAALRRFASTEGGEVSTGMFEGSASVTLTLPSLRQARAAGG